jgi:hypothetical protein
MMPRVTKTYVIKDSIQIYSVLSDPICQVHSNLVTNRDFTQGKYIISDFMGISDV